MSTSIEDRLQELLDEKDSKIRQLENQLEEHEDELELDRVRWRVPTERPMEDETLPVPRLQMQYTPVGRNGGWGDFEVLYCLVYRHLLDTAIYLPMGLTRIGGGSERVPILNGEIDLPFRDGAHIRSDMRNLNLRGFAICNGVVNELKQLEDKPKRN